MKGSMVSHRKLILYLEPDFTRRDQTSWFLSGNDVDHFTRETTRYSVAVGPEGQRGQTKVFCPREKLPSMYVSMILKLTGPFTLSLLRILRWRTRDCPSIYCLQDSNNLQMFAPRVKISSDAPATQGIAMKCFGFQMSRKWLTSRHMIQSQKNDSPETKIIVGKK